MSRRKRERKRLEEGGVDSEVFDNAVATFIFEILTRQVQPADNLCNVDHYAVRDAYTLSYMFPQSRFVMVVRDGRAVAHSKMPVNHTSTEFNSTLYEEHLQAWEDQTRDMLTGCLAVGRLYCLAVYYEHLFLHPIHALQRILTFLNIPFPRHYDERGFLFYDKMEEILVRGNNPKFQKQLTTWVQCAPKLAFKEGNATHLLSTFGYLQLGNPPDYQNLNQRAILSEMLY
ncbi:hypothetical protein GE061_005737 [Apolygus lucorum]|uniref:Protein-tyrosine sulfotransferase n=1 Tax=Apolygus lucorum TaxID=248454 RepID=A0A6A4IWZ2_APOLU|nr:hypothetical protein GE061_005737 [Apolygus lucorum]